MLVSPAGDVSIERLIFVQGKVGTLHIDRVEKIDELNGPFEDVELPTLHVDLEECRRLQILLLQTFRKTPDGDLVDVLGLNSEYVALRRCRLQKRRRIVTSRDIDRSRSGGRTDGYVEKP